MVFPSYRVVDISQPLLRIFPASLVATGRSWQDDLASVKALVWTCRLGPAVVFLPPQGKDLPRSAAVTASRAVIGPAYSQVAARGHGVSWDKYCQHLMTTPPYAGKWRTEDVPDAITPGQALHIVRRREAGNILDGG